MRVLQIATLVGIASVMTGAAGPKTPLAGIWGAPGARLAIDAQGGRLEQDCAGGSFGPVHADAKGRFNASGQFEAYESGPQQADIAPEATARFEGAIQGNMLRLTIHPAKGAVQTMALVKDRRVKLIRCL